MATSTDGRNFTYGGTVLHTGMLPSNPTRCGMHVMLVPTTGRATAAATWSTTAAPSFAEENGRLYMFYEAGQRRNTNIAIARTA